jgi:hypothetical protein
MSFKAIVLILCLFAVAAFAVPAHATSANFRMSCAFQTPPTNVDCTGDPSQPSGNPSSCGTSSFNSYFWTWGDGSNPQGALHTYSDGHLYVSPSTYETVCVTVLCADGTYATDCRTLCTLSNTSSCPSGDIVVNGTYN